MAKLPIHSILEEFKLAYAQVQNLIVTATPGAGKTTQIAPALLKSGLIPAGKKILMLQPRRLAAKAVAARIAEENNWSLGRAEVGYQVRFEKRFQENTQLLIMTEGILSRKLIEDSTLSDVACVILDEFHERSVYTDLSIALLKELQSVFRPDLKLIVMSATLESQALQKYLPQAKLFQAEGRIFPLRVIQQAKLDRRDYAKRLEEQLVDALQFLLSADDDDQGNLLVFLPGVAEIKRAVDKLSSLAQFKNFEVLELHGSLSLQEQSKVLGAGQKRRIILSTNIAETSLTVPGVSSVIDSGWAKVLRWDPAKNFEKLEVSRISLASVKQRAGRAAREKAGRVYQLWSKDDELKFRAFEDPEMTRVDLSPTLLTLAAWGVSDFEAFDWFEKPSSARLQVALEQLKSLGALDAQLHLTSIGKQLQRIPLNPRMALALLVAKKLGQEERMSIALSLLGEKDPVVNFAKFKATSSHVRECDLESRVEALLAIEQGDAAPAWGMDTQGVRRCLSLAADLVSVTQGLPGLSLETPLKPPCSLAQMLWYSYSDRLCRRREKGTAKALMLGGRGVLLSSDSELEKAEYFLALELMDGQNSKETKIHKATSLSLGEIKVLAGVQVRERVQSDVNLETFKIQQSRIVSYQDLILEGPFPVSIKDSGASIADNLRDLSESIVKNWEAFAARFEVLSAFDLRIGYLKKYCPELEVEGLSFDAKVSLAEATIEHTQKSSPETIDFEMLLSAFYPPQQMKLIDRHCPKSILVPSGRHIKLEYSPDFETVKCSVKLQELFGLAASPSILQNRVQILFDLLSPAQQPMQSTKDLSSFWINIYPEVRAQMKIRYPRHPWPEDPWTATPTHKTKARVR